MLRSATLALIIALSATACALGQASVPIGGPSKINADRLRWMQYKMVAGRIAVSSSYPGTNMTFGPAHVDGRRRERLEIHINQTQIDLQYELASPDEQLSIALVDGKRLSIRRERSQPKFTLVFEQNPDQPLLFSLNEGERRLALRADSFWHMYLREPELVRKRLVPVLEILHPSWQLASLGAALEESLFEHAQNPQPLDADRWNRLVGDLASPKFSDRTTAERELRAAGQVILPFLQNVNRDRLDAEQASRIRAIVDSLAVSYEDSIDRIASWLAGDEQIWLSLMSRPEVARRRLAAKQLSMLVGAPVDFDPSADEARREAQIERLRQRLHPAPASEPAADE
jgi:hypothetical protein